MRKALGMTLMVGLLIGCGRQGPPVRVSGPGTTRPPAGLQGQAPGVAAAAPEVVTAERLAEQMGHSDPYIRRHSIQSLRKLGDPGFRYLLQGMTSNSWEVRLESLRALDKGTLLKHGQETWPVVTGMLKDKHPLVRHEAIARLEWFREESRAALSLLRELLDKDPDPDVRLLAANAMINLYGSIPKLLPLLTDSNPFLRKQVAVHLGESEGDGQQVMPYLQRVAETDSDPDVRQAAEQSLSNLLRGRTEK